MNHTKQTLQRHIQNFYADYLRDTLVDTVEIDVRGVVFGYPIGGGHTGLVRFIPYANGEVGVQYGTYYDTGKGVTEWYDVEKWPDIDCYMILGEEIDPSDKPERPRTDYRQY